MKKNFLLGYFLLSLLIITLSFRFSPNLYSYFSLLILIPVLLIISFLNFKNKLFKKKVLIYEMLLIFLVSISPLKVKSSTNISCLPSKLGTKAIQEFIAL